MAGHVITGGQREPLLTDLTSAVRDPRPSLRGRVLLFSLTGCLAALLAASTRGLARHSSSAEERLVLPGWPVSANPCGIASASCMDATAVPIQRLEATMKKLKKKLSRLRGNTKGWGKKATTFASSELSHLQYVDKVRLFPSRELCMDVGEDVICDLRSTQVRHQIEHAEARVRVFLNSPGPQGPSGFRGSPGTPGPEGRIGGMGPMGFNGLPGLDGPEGREGREGRMGGSGQQVLLASLNFLTTKFLPLCLNQDSLVQSFLLLTQTDTVNTGSARTTGTCWARWRDWLGRSAWPDWATWSQVLRMKEDKNTEHYKH